MLNNMAYYVWVDFKNEKFSYKIFSFPTLSVRVPFMASQTKYFLRTALEAVKIQIYEDLHLAVVEFQSVSDMKEFPASQLMIKDTKLAIVKFPPK